MTQPADLAHDVLLRVAEFLRKLPTEELADLATGEAKLEVVPKGGRRAAATKTAVALPRPAQEIATTMRGIGDQAAARRYLETDLKLTAPQLKQLAADLGVTASGVKAKILDALVDWAVGRRSEADAISRVGAVR